MFPTLCSFFQSSDPMKVRSLMKFNAGLQTLQSITQKPIKSQAYLEEAPFSNKLPEKSHPRLSQRGLVGQPPGTSPDLIRS